MKGPPDQDYCSQGHPPIWYYGPETDETCPVCSANKEADRRVAVVQEKLDNALARIEDYRTELGL